METKDRRITQFTDKYTGSGSIGNFLVSNFFRTIESLSRRDSRSVLEVGCGAGYSLVHLRKFFDDGTAFSACDIDPELVRLAKEKNPSISCDVASIYELPYGDKSFDTVVCLEVLEHLDDPEKALSELARVAKKYVIISTPHEPIWRILNCARGKYLSQYGNTPGHINHWSSGGLAKLVSKYFDVIAVNKPLPWTIIYGKSKGPR